MSIIEILEDTRSFADGAHALSRTGRSPRRRHVDISRRQEPLRFIYSRQAILIVTMILGRGDDELRHQEGDDMGDIVRVRLFYRTRPFLLRMPQIRARAYHELASSVPGKKPPSAREGAPAYAPRYYIYAYTGRDKRRLTENLKTKTKPSPTTTPSL